MKAFRNLGGNVVEVDVDVDLNGNPILPPDTTVAAKPAANPDHYVTVVGNAWVQIPIPQEFVAFSYKKQKAMEALSKYKDYYINLPVTHDSVVFDADEQARSRLTQAIFINTATSYLPPAWIAADNTPYSITVLADLMGIVSAVQTAFATRFFEMDAIRQQIMAAADDAALSAITIPVIPTLV